MGFRKMFVFLQRKRWIKVAELMIHQNIFYAVSRKSEEADEEEIFRHRCEGVHGSKLPD